MSAQYTSVPRPVVETAGSINTPMARRYISALPAQRVFCECAQTLCQASLR
jgi:hypothetical protein